jgi:hypothetical protein
MKNVIKYAKMIIREEDLEPLSSQTFKKDDKVKTLYSLIYRSTR